MKYVLKIVFILSPSLAALSMFQLFTAASGPEVRFALSVFVGSVLIFTLAGGFIAVVEAIEKLQTQDSKEETDEVIVQD